MLKIYGIDNRTAAIITIPINEGKAKFVCEFRHGMIGRGRNNRPATYATVDVTEQNIIERSAYYGRLIRLVRVVGGDTGGIKARTKAKKAETANEVHPEITSKEEMIAFLKAYGAKATDLASDSSIKKYIEKAGLDFPNYMF